MTMPGRNFQSDKYRYGFNGKEKDKDISEGGQDYGLRISDNRLGRFLSVDPLTGGYPNLTPYQFASNSPIAGIDLDGGEFKVYHLIQVEKNGKTQLQVGDYRGQSDIALTLKAKISYTKGVGPFGLIPITVSVPVRFNFNYSEVGISADVVDVNGSLRILPQGLDWGSLPPLDDPIWESMETPDEFRDRIVAEGNELIQAIDEAYSIWNAVRGILSSNTKPGQSLGVKDNVRDKYVNNTRGWKKGNPINNLTSQGNVPSWSTIRGRYWKNRGLNAKGGEFSEKNLKRMRKGNAPRLFDPGTGKVESVELHHPKGRGDGNLFQFEELLPSQHAAKDPYRKLKKG